MASKDSKSKSTEYFPPLSEIQTDDEHSSSENESADETNSKKQKSTNPSSSPTAAESENSTDGAKHGALPSNFAKLFAYGLVGMTIDYNGDILDSSKKSCGKASGDITEMVGQKIDEDGLIRSAAGEVVGQVAQNYGLQEAVAAMLEAQKKMGGGGNRESNAGHTEERKKTSTTGASEGSQGLPNIWQGTAGEGPPGNDIHLNVQSTKEGISMSIRIPTMFMKEQHRQFEEQERERQKNAKDPESS